MSRTLRFHDAAGVLRFVLMLAGATGLARAQVPEGWYATSHFKICDAAWSGTGRIRIIDPESGNVFEVGGVPAELLSVPCSGSAQGASSILVRPEDGAIIIGESTSAGNSLDIFLLHLDGVDVSGWKKFSLGSTTGGEVTQMAFLPDGKILFSVFGIGSGISMGILDLTAEGTDAARLIRTSSILANAEAIAMDAENGAVYVGIGDSFSASRIYRASLSDLLDFLGSDASDALEEIATLPLWITNLAIAPDGRVLAVGFGASTGLFAVDPDTGWSERLCADVIHED